MDQLWKGIAIAGIWIGIGIVGWKDGGAATLAAFFGMFATIAVASC